MITTPNNGSFSSNLTFAQYESNALPSWLSFNSSTANITSTDPDTLGSDTYTITNTYKGVYDSLFTFSTNLNISVVEFIPTNTTNTNTTNTNTTSSSSSNDDKYCFDTSSEAVCGIVITAIAVAGLVLIILTFVCICCILKRGRKKASKVEVQQDHQCVQQTDHQLVDIPNVQPETMVRCINAFIQDSDNKI